MMDVNDRGIKKWTSIMLPEHVEALKTVFDELDQKEKPILDDQQKAEIDYKLQLALNNDLTVAVDYFNNHDSYKIQGKLVSVGGYLKLDNMDKVPINDIIDVEIL
jgi:hypothetical protein